ncbi:MAG: glutamine synthetase III [Bacteroides sp.]|nr:glutamine synthetase III [Eubacterium sp.]MCM1418967.1 glutamine synthetase III [Roseburia sp.]MCM1463097.1 glutamine synthetase III [Bacteroides sp.]
MAERYDVTQIFGEDVFDVSTMRNRLPKDVFKKLKATMNAGKELDESIAESVATAMKDWAIEKGATHYTHWFQPMTGVTAEKHDSFISPTGDGTVLLEFSGKELIKGEPDASSFPSGGIRATFEARGYTAWDPTSYAFIKDQTLYIPTAFCSYTGEALDKKTPLLRSMDAISAEAIRILRLFGNTSAKRVVATVGAEQEYFLIDKSVFEKRKDLMYTGRTLFGAPAPKGQELEDHYFGVINQRVSDYMKELDNTLWRLGVMSKTKHNEVAPAQHENAPIFTSANLAADQNQLTMELMRKIATKHGMACLLHEKPFAGVNGSGKHDNWAISTDSGQNLLSPGDSPLENAQFLTFLAAIVKGVDDYAELLRLSVATAGNDHRLGANEAPPAVISIFLGEELDEVVKAIISGGTVSEKKTRFDIGVSALPKFKKDTTDRNRTSPFAFTGNKFEFRMVGSTHNVATPNIVLNTIVAESLAQFADELEKADNFEKALHELLVKTFSEHQRIIFNGNGYDDAWIKEAVEKRGLPNLKSTVDAIPHFEDEKAIKLFTKHKVFTEREIHARTEILLENYYKTINIEAHTVAEMVARDYTPAVMKYEKFLCDLIATKKAAGIDTSVETASAAKISALASEMTAKNAELSALLAGAAEVTDVLDTARYYHDKVFAQMNAIRAVVDELETLVAADYWPVPTYGEILFSVK